MLTLLTAAQMCSRTEGIGNLLSLIGILITAFKVIVPILLIVFGMLDVGKSVVAGKPEEITKNLKSFAMRAAAAIVIFFIPAIVGLVMTAVSDSGGQDAKGWESCRDVLGLK